MRIKGFQLFVAITLSVVVVISCTLSSFSHKQERIKGFNLVAPPQEIAQEDMQKLSELGIEWVAAIPYAFCKPNAPEVRFNPNGQWWGETPDGTRETILLAKKAGLKVMLKPHLWVAGQGWAGDLKFEEEADWLIWENSYKEYVLTFAKIAEEQAVELFCIGTEVRQSTATRPKFWTELIKEVKAVYSGKLTYAANWDEYDEVPFWAELDFIGVDAYFPLSDQKTPTVEDLVKGWKEPELALKKLSQQYKKPILFTEYGYESIDYSAIGHWNVKQDTLNENQVAQDNAFLALHNNFKTKDWWAGGFIWKWHFTKPRRRGLEKTFTPQEKKAMKSISEYFQAK